ncbi:MAG TPA: DUF1801 domain-containing protein [Fulvivirga sp.]|nr:DUF1801 domain-containing protein [Fulvivirga sp.]
MKAATSVDRYIANQPNYLQELKILREILLGCELEETIKWGAPMYTYDGKNIVGIGAFKSYFGLWFFQGALLPDKSKKLINAQEGTTKAMRQWRFESIDEIDKKLIKDYVKEAIANQKAGKMIKPEKKPLVIPELLKEALASNPELSENFDSMSLSCKREHAEYITDAKKEETQRRRLEKIIPMIRDKKGLNDKYR